MQSSSSWDFLQAPPSPAPLSPLATQDVLLSWVMGFGPEIVYESKLEWELKLVVAPKNLPTWGAIALLRYMGVSFNSGTRT